MVEVTRMTTFLHSRRHPIPSMWYTATYKITILANLTCPTVINGP